VHEVLRPETGINTNSSTHIHTHTYTHTHTHTHTYKHKIEEKKSKEGGKNIYIECIGNNVGNKHHRSYNMVESVSSWLRISSVSHLAVSHLAVYILYVVYIRILFIFDVSYLDAVIYSSFHEL
jgi:RNase adaptor protein for sRNA GlmZ degradation